MVDHLLASNAFSDSAVAYYYFDYRDQNLQTPASFTASILRQLVTQMPLFPESIVELYELYKYQEVRGLLAPLRLLLRDICSSFNMCFFLIDALDECVEKSVRKTILEILEQLKSEKVKVFVTSRPHTYDIGSIHKNALKIKVNASEADLRTYCFSMIDASENTSELLGENDALRALVVDTISQNADGM